MYSVRYKYVSLNYPISLLTRYFLFSGHYLYIHIGRCIIRLNLGLKDRTCGFMGYTALIIIVLSHHNPSGAHTYKRLSVSRSCLHCKDFSRATFNIG